MSIIEFVRDGKILDPPELNGVPMDKKSQLEELEKATPAFIEFIVKDSGKRKEFAGGMVRDTQEGKVEGDRCAEGPMLRRWGEHLTKGAVKYPDRAPGQANWTLASGEEEYVCFRKSAWRHFMRWWNGKVDEDHAAAVFFNINGAEYVKYIKEAKDGKVERA